MPLRPLRRHCRRALNLNASMPQMASEGFATFLWPKVYGRRLKVVHAWRCLGSKRKADRFTGFMAYRLHEMHAVLRHQWGRQGPQLQAKAAGTVKKRLAALPELKQKLKRKWRHTTGLRFHPPGRVSPLASQCVLVFCVL